MTNYLIRRFFQMGLVVIAASMAIYYILWLAPGGPLDELKLVGAGGRANQGFTEEQIQRISEYLGLHRGPVWGYIAWLTGEDWFDSIGKPELQTSSCRSVETTCSRGVLRGDFGVSWNVARGSPVADVLLSRLRNTLILMTSATIISLLVAIPIGIISAVKQYSRLDYFVTTFSFFGTAMPVFWFGLMMIILFGGNQSPLYKAFGFPYLPTGNVTLVRNPLPGSLLELLNATPGSSLDIAVHAILPTIVLSLLYMAGWSRFMRTAMLEVLRQDYVRTARAKGLRERVVILKHAMRNGLIPLITIVVFQIPGIFGGATITETVFNWPGMGFLYVHALGATDYPVAMAFLFISAVLVVIASLIGDVLYTIVDPRIRLE
ncbi:MAG: ABC transporter permease [Anaerolineales bacterium]|nr:MAG: ABC transporter permease [Chloroflexota bacterium]MCK6584293.1 ABC transporter permease [Anaerolineales bacterium]GJQ36467.1 MAG: ABC transporter permease [Anaerolineaceae bacterium]